MENTDGAPRSGLSSKLHAVIDTNGLPMRLALTTGNAVDSLYSRCWPALKSGAMSLVDLWIVVMMRSTVRTAQLTGKHPTETNPERVDLNGARNPVELFFNKIEQHRRVAIPTLN
jgi:hypothetical protein